MEKKIMDPRAHAQRKRRALFLEISGIVIMTLVPMVFLSFAVTNEVGAIRAALKERAELYADLDAIVRLNNDRSKADAVIAHIETIVPVGIDVPSKVFSDIKTLAKLRGLIADVGFISEEKGPVGIDFSANTLGSLPALAAFLNDLEQMKSAVAIHAVKVIRGSLSYSLTLTATIYTRN